MVLGFNHNVMYKGELFHVQTEDSGIAIPHIITLLYRGGVILCSKKTSYSDILKMDNIEVVVEELMKEQHKEMMRRLKAGEFDERAFPEGVQSAGNNRESAPDSSPSPTLPVPPPPAREIAPVPAAAKLPHPPLSLPRESATFRPGHSRTGRISLDDAIRDFFAAHEK
jgi:hypothetical protein